MTMLNGNTDGDVLGERADIDYFKQKLEQNIANGTPLEHSSNDRLRNQIELLEDAVVIYKCIRSPDRRIL